MDIADRENEERDGGGGKGEVLHKKLLSSVHIHGLRLFPSSVVDGEQPQNVVLAQPCEPTPSFPPSAALGAALRRAKYTPDRRLIPKVDCGVPP
jgi:hypothetical protein